MFVWYNNTIRIRQSGRREARAAVREENVHARHRARKREQFLQRGADGFADHELLELLLFYAIPRQDVNPLAHTLIDRFGTLYGVLYAPVEELLKVEGVGLGAAALITLVGPLFQRARLSNREETVLDTTERLGAFFMERFQGVSQETMYQVSMDAKGRLLALRKLSEGCSQSVNVNIRLVVENALHCGATLVALAHNHPSGVALPSDEDMETTLLIRDGLRTVGVELVDHIVVADEDYVSMRQEGVL